MSEFESPKLNMAGNSHEDPEADAIINTKKSKPNTCLNRPDSIETRERIIKKEIFFEGIKNEKLN